MNGAFMLTAFVLGFWCIWSANRDVNSIMESLGITIVAIVAKSLMEWSGPPEFNSTLLAVWGILFVYSVITLEMIDRFSNNMSLNLTIAIGSAVGWFFLAQWLFSAEGMAKVGSWVA